MCGIAGVVRLRPDVSPPTREQALAMAERIRHRGPDGRDAWASPSGECTLGHARLKVIDLETGDQPMANEDGTVQVVFNGEIYNFPALRAELEREGHRFRTRSDTEVLVHGYEAWGEALPERLDGMFAFGIWDEARGRLLLARDRAGKKPIFWTRTATYLGFASEIKALLTLPWVSGEMDPEALPAYLAFGYVPAPRTFHRVIDKLPPAHSLSVEDGVATRRRYWTLDWRRLVPGISDADAGSRVRALLGDAVERRLTADVPLGAFLSGGIDSTLVVGLMRERMEGPLHTFSLGFADDPNYDETAFARLAARRFGSEHTEFTVEAHAVELVDELVDTYDEPFGDSSGIPTHIVSGLTREHVTVALTGDGGDEMFCGYPRLVGMEVAERTGRLLARLGEAVGRRLPHHPDFRHPARRFQRFFAAAALEPQERMLRWIGYIPELEAFLRPDVCGVDREELTRSLRKPWDRLLGESALTRAMAMTFETYLPDDLLVKADRCAMAHGLELRSPFLDTAVMEFAAGLPDRLRRRGRTLKWLLKEAFSDLLPDEIRSRSKWGFGVPLPLWFRTHWKPLFEARVLAPGARVRRWIEPAPVDRLWREHQAGAADHGHALWALLTLETWLRARD